jgi:methylglutaconyl-CoA hydratase
MNAILQTIAVGKAGKVLEIRLFRPQVKNAFNPVMIRELTEIFASVANEKDVRAVSLSGQGGVFCSGGDLNWMKETLAYTAEENLEDAETLYRLFETMDACRVPIVASVEGFALGGGVGLVSVSDYVIARRDAQFSLSEVRVGLIPACIGPFVLRKIGESQARALFLSGERFDAGHAQRIGLVHEVAADTDMLEAARRRVLDNICSASPQAVAVAKDFLRQLARRPFAEHGGLAARTLADIRVSPEAQEGLRAFLEKRPPSWQTGQAGQAPAP